jgi:fimbrial chaperone protein
VRFGIAARAGALALMLAFPPLHAADVSVAPLRADLRAGALNETITVSNRSPAPLRVAIRLVEWTQDEQGKDVYRDTGDLVYFPRLANIEPEGKALVRVGARAPGGPTERTYRLFIEEQVQPTSDARAEVQVAFRFSLPVFLAPVSPRTELEVGEAKLERGRLLVPVRNGGNVHARLQRVTVDNGAGFRREVGGWYVLAGAQRTYALDIPPEICRKSGTLNVAVEGEGVRADRQLHVDAARCV